MADLGVTHDQVMADLKERGITQAWLNETGHARCPLVTWARGYRRYITEEYENKDGRKRRRLIERDREILKATYASLPQSWQKSCMTRWANQSDGLMRPHHYLPEMEGLLRRLHMGDPHIYTQIRPDAQIRTGEIIEHEPHWDVTGEWRFHLVRHATHGARKGLSREEGGLSNEEINGLSREEIIEIANARRGQPGWKPWSRSHSWPKRSRFLNVPAPKCDRKPHDHEISYKGKPLLLDQHLERYHPDGDVIGLHEWIDPKTGKVARIKDDRYEYAKRIDINRLVSAQMLRDAEVWIVVSEGAQKADAALAQILSDDGLLCGQPAAVISYPAVGQGDARELKELVRRYGRGTTMFVVADSDAYENPDVMMQSNRARQRLVQFGAREAHLMLPPEAGGEGVKVGLDDALGKYKLRLEHCTAIRRDVADWEEHRVAITIMAPRGTYANRLNASASLTHSLSQICHHETRESRISQRALARDMGWRYHNRVGDNKEFLASLGLLKVTKGSLDRVEDDYSFGARYTHTPTTRLHEKLSAKFWWGTVAEFFGRDITHGSSNERKDMSLIATEEQLAQDAERFMEIAQEIFTIALRWQTRFPRSEILQATVDRFLNEALIGH
jgi:hypothetical protein